MTLKGENSKQGFHSVSLRPSKDDFSPNLGRVSLLANSRSRSSLWKALPALPSVISLSPLTPEKQILTFPLNPAASSTPGHRVCFSLQHHYLVPLS